jgi:hypothetical protein
VNSLLLPHYIHDDLNKFHGFEKAAQQGFNFRAVEVVKHGLSFGKRIAATLLSRLGHIHLWVFQLRQKSIAEGIIGPDFRVNCTKEEA